MKRLAILVMLVGFLIVGASQLIAQTTRCASIEEVTAFLATQYQEELIARGTGPDGQDLLTFVHPDGKTWTIVVTGPDGRACMVASGVGWTTLERTPAGSET
jgi:hypothetical protein